MAKPGTAKVSKLKVETKLVGAALHGSQFVEDSMEMEDFHELVLYGPSGVGKTFCAMTASEFWPEELPAKKKVMLEDTLHVAFDKNAGAGLKANNIAVPTINVPKLMMGYKENGKHYTVLDILQIVSDETHEFVATKGVRNIVVDTVSKLDKLLVEYWEKNCPVGERSGKKDTRAMWTLLSTSHTRFHNDMTAVPANFVWNFHAMAKIETETKEGQNEALKNRAAGLTDIVFDITGKSINLYNGESSAIFYMLKTGGLKPKRELHTTGGTFLAKNRWEGALEEVEAPNLRSIFAKIEARDLSR